MIVIFSYFFRTTDVFPVEGKPSPGPPPKSASRKNEPHSYLYPCSARSALGRGLGKGLPSPTSDLEILLSYDRAHTVTHPSLYASHHRHDELGCVRGGLELLKASLHATVLGKHALELGDGIHVVHAPMLQASEK